MSPPPPAARPRSMDPDVDPKLARALRVSMKEQRTKQQAESRGEQDATNVPAIPPGLAKEKGGNEAPPQKAPALAMARSMEPNKDPELARDLRVSKEQQRMRKQAEGGGEQDTAVVPETLGGLAEEESN